MVRSSFRAFLGVLIMSAGLIAAPAKTTLPEQYDKWIKRDVVYLITDEEKKAFLKLGTDAERDHFIEDFWAARNPAPGSSVNKFKEEHYRRLQYATDNF